MAARDGEVGYDRLHYFIGSGIFGEAPLEAALLVEADRRVGLIRSTTWMMLHGVYDLCSTASEWSTWRLPPRTQVRGRSNVRRVSRKPRNARLCSRGSAALACINHVGELTYRR
jgi:hypothetical protein